MSAEAIPKWVAEEIRNAKFDQVEEMKGSGYLLDINKKDRKVDVQFYDKLADGRYIATMDLSKEFDADAIELAVVYLFNFKAKRATLDEKVVTFLKEKFQMDMTSLYQFELESIEKLEE